MNLGILFGGNSLEHEISIVSAMGLRKKLEDKYNITMIYVNHQNEIFDASKMRLDDFKYDNFRKLKKSRFVKNGIRKRRIDCMLLCVHGENSEDGVMASLCRFYNIPFVGSDVLASSIGMDKLASYRYLSKNNVPMIDTTLYTYSDYLVGKEIKDYPIILKPLYGGSSIGIYVCKNKKEFDENIIKAFEVSQRVIVQPYYDNIAEYNLAIYEEGYSKLERIVKKDEIFSFNNKYNESFKMMHQSLDDDILFDQFSKIGKEVYDLLGCSGIIRIDFFLIDNKIFVNEVNIIPGALAMYLFEDFNKVIDVCIRNAITKRKIVYQKGNFLIKSNINK